MPDNRIDITVTVPDSIFQRLRTACQQCPEQPIVRQTLGWGETKNNMTVVLEICPHIDISDIAVWVGTTIVSDN